MKRLRDYDPDSRVVLLRQPGTLGWCDRREDVEVVDVPAARSTARRLWWARRSLDRLLGELRADVFVSFSNIQPKRRDVFGILGVLNLAPFSPDAMASEPGVKGQLRLRILRRLMLASARRADRVFALSEATRDAMGVHGADVTKIAVIPNGVDEDVAPIDRVVARALMGHDWPGDDYLLYVSHFYPYKNFISLVLAYAALPDELRQRHRLVLVGRPMDAAYHRSVLAAIKAGGVADRVTIIPGVTHEKIAALQAGASLFVFPSLVENCPNALLEAMRCGTPLACSDSPSMPEFGGDAAAYFDGHDVESISTTLRDMLSDPARLTEMGRLAAERSHQYTWDRFTHDLVGLYRDVA